MRKQNKNSIGKYYLQQGFTLVELLLYTGLFTILLLVLLQLFTSIINVQLESESTSSLAQDGQYMLARFAYDISRASTVTTPAVPGTTANVLSLTINGTTTTYTLSQGDLLLGTDRLNGYGTQVSNFSAELLSSASGIESVHVSFTVSPVVKAQSGLKTEVFQTTVSTRSQ